VTVESFSVFSVERIAGSVFVATLVGRPFRHESIIDAFGLFIFGTTRIVWRVGGGRFLQILLRRLLQRHYFE
jgi:hypothetical protein